MMKILSPVFLLFSVTIFAQELITPLEQNNYEKVTSYNDLVKFVDQLDQKSDLLKVEVLGNSVEGRNLFVLKFSSGEFGNDASKIRVLIFAQQHGNEQSGKEGTILLAQKLINPEYLYLFDKIDLAIVPQMNPDGSELNQRRNGNDTDLNRNHLILKEPETKALHQLFDKYLFEVTMDVHEYYPYDEAWMKYGYRKNSDITVGAITSINVSEKIRNFSNGNCLPFILKYLTDRNFSSFEYCPGGPPAETYLRHSTFDINDGRQSLGIQNTLSFIQEGMNGEDSFVQNIKHRAIGQMTGMMGLLEFVYLRNKKIKSLVASERKKLVSGSNKEEAVIQMEHIGNCEKLILPVYAYSAKSDSMVIVDDFRPVVKSLFAVTTPEGYLIPKQSKELSDWVDRQALISGKFDLSGEYTIEQYFITRIDSIDFEGETIVDPDIEKKELKNSIQPEDYLFIPVAQLKGNMIIQALEPKSMLGLATYRQYSYLLKAGEAFPVLRVVRKTQ
jgi:hypothetical protein